MAETYEIRWRGEVYHAGDLTDEKKNRYCVELYRHMLDNARKVKSAKDYMEFDRKLIANLPEWTSLPSWDVLESLNTKWGEKTLMRIILDIDRDVMNDDELDEMVKEKEADQTSDLNIAMKLIKEAADPKAPKGGPGSPRPKAENEPTPASAMSQSA